MNTLRRSAVVLLIGIALPGLSYSQVEEEEVETDLENMGDQLDQWGNRMDEWGQEVEQAVEAGKPIPELPPLMLGTEDERGVKLGLYLDDLDFEEAYERHYPENYGVLITGVVKGGNADRAGLVKGDIIMEFDGEKVRFEDHLISLRDTKHVGDSAQVKFFRNEKILTTKIYFLPPAPEVDKKGKVISKKKLSPGFGGGGFQALVIDYDFPEIREYLQLNGFKDLNSGYLAAWGGGGMGTIGKGWFIGGMGGGLTNEQKIQVLASDSSLIGYRKYRLDFGYGGATITKKYPLFTERLVLDFSIMLGGGGVNLTVSQTDGDFSWGNQVDKGDTYSVTYKKNFFAYRPSVGLLIRIKNWVGIHGSVGYFGTYVTDKSWTDELFDFTVTPAAGKSSPDLPNSLSYSLGFWFGF